MAEVNPTPSPPTMRKITNTQILDARTGEQGAEYEQRGGKLHDAHTTDAIGQRAREPCADHAADHGAGHRETAHGGVQPEAGVGAGDGVHGAVDDRGVIANRKPPTAPMVATVMSLACSFVGTSLF